MAIAAVLKTAVRKDFWVRIPGPPSYIVRSAAHASPCIARWLAPPRPTRDITGLLGGPFAPRGDVAERLKATVC